MYRLPAASTAAPEGTNNSALVAGPPSPEKSGVPFPATVLIMPWARANEAQASTTPMSLQRLPDNKNFIMTMLLETGWVAEVFLRQRWAQSRWRKGEGLGATQSKY